MEIQTSSIIAIITSVTWEHSCAKFLPRSRDSRRLMRSCWDCRDLSAEILSWCFWVSQCYRQIVVRFPASCQDCGDLAMTFVGFSNLVKSTARFSTSCRDWWDLTKIAEISLWSLTLSESSGKILPLWRLNLFKSPKTTQRLGEIKKVKDWEKFCFQALHAKHLLN